MERIEVNVMTGEVKTIQLTQEEIDALLTNQPSEPIVDSVDANSINILQE